MGAEQSSPRTIGPYEVVEELGRGCMGVVYRVNRPADGKQFALKVVLDERPSDEAVGRFAREAQVGIRLRHPGIVPVVDLGQAGGRMYLVMEYCPGPTLKDKLREGGPMPAAEAAEFAAKIADAMAVAHEQGVLHRDLKPANVILDVRTGIPRITDFGLARDQRDNRDLTVSGQAVGTPSHMAPEQIRGLQIDPRAEVWSLGVLLYECISGRLPFPAETYTEVGSQILHEEPPSPGGDLPALAAYVLGMLSKNKDQRPENMRVVARKLRELADPIAYASISRGGSASLPVLAGVVAGVAVLVLALLLVWLLFWEPDVRPPPPPPPPNPAETEPELDPRAEELLEEAGELAGAREVADLVLPLYAEAEPLLQEFPELLTRLRKERLELLYRRGRYTEVLREAEGLIAAGDPALVYPAWRLKGWALLRLEKRAAGLEVWKELAKLDPEGVEGLAARSRSAFYSGDTAHGVQFNREALDLEDPQNPCAFLRITAAYGALQQGDPKRAMEFLDQAERMVSDSPELDLIRAFVFQRTRNFKNARKSIEAALELTAPRGFSQALEVLGGVALQQRDSAGALEAYTRLIDDFDNGRGLFQRAQIRWNLKRPRKARDDLARLRDDFPQVWAQVNRKPRVKAWCAQVLKVK